MANGGEDFTLTDAGSTVIDTANGDGGGWPAGTSSPNYYTMERSASDAADTDANWVDNDGVRRNGLDANGNPLNATPRALNSAWIPPIDEADLSVQKDGAASVVSGNFEYMITVTNIGTADATNVTITEMLPAGVTYVSDTSGLPPHAARCPNACLECRHNGS